MRTRLMAEATLLLLLLLLLGCAGIGGVRGFVTDEEILALLTGSSGPPRPRRSINASVVPSLSSPLLTTTTAAHGGHRRQLAAYSRIGYGEIAKELGLLEETYPGFIEVTTAQEAYGLPSPGECTGADNQPTPCKQYIVRVTDEATLAQEPERPEVFISGELHGDERIGPVVSMHVLRLLLKAAHCVATREREGKDAATATTACEDATGISPPTLEWLAHLVRSRILYVMPMTNAIGYDHHQRTENGLDPNRDFPYRQPPDKCMLTVTGRSINELWREHLFQLAITFHGGMESITYEWGAFNHHKDGHDVSPDDTAQTQIATVMSRYAGHFDKTPDYQFGRTNDIVYPVDGGMEDWAYAASWDNEFTDPAPVTPCNPPTYGGYPQEKTVYNNLTMRAFNILVETSNRKDPDALGTDDKLWIASGDGSGHVTRNVRLALSVIDLVEPYVHWADSALSAAGCQWGCHAPTIELEEGGKDEVELRWRVGGAISVDETQLLWGPWPAAPKRKRRGLQKADLSTLEGEEEGATCEACGLRKGEEWAAAEATGKGGGQSGVQTGFTRWHYGDAKRRGRKLQESSNTMNGKEKRQQQLAGNGEGGGGTTTTTSLQPTEEEEGRIAGLEDPIFAQTLALSDLLKTSAPDEGDNDNDNDASAFFVVARAKVDQDWAQSESPPHPNVPPQSHVVNARTNPHWLAEHNGHVVRGRLDWYSPPIKVLIKRGGGGAQATTATAPAAAATTTEPQEEEEVEEGTPEEEEEAEEEEELDDDDGEEEEEQPLPATEQEASSSSSSIIINKEPPSEPKEQQQQQQQGEEEEVVAEKDRTRMEAQRPAGADVSSAEEEGQAASSPSSYTSLLSSTTTGPFFLLVLLLAAAVGAAVVSRVRSRGGTGVRLPASGRVGRGAASPRAARRGGSGSLGSGSGGGQAVSYAPVGTEEEGEAFDAYDRGLDEGPGGGLEMRGPRGVHHVV